MAETNCCPECESTQIRSLSAHVTRDREADGWRCQDCGLTFDAPEAREARNPLDQEDPTAPPEHTLAGKLHDMDADDLGGGADA